MKRYAAMFCVLSGTSLLAETGTLGVELETVSTKTVPVVSPKVVSYELNTDIIYKIRVGTDKVSTTISFPSPLQEITGANVTANSRAADPRNYRDGKTMPGFYLSYRKGSYYLTVNALKDGAIGSLNIIYNRQTYILQLFADSRTPFGSVRFFEPPDRLKSGKKGMSLGQTSHPTPTTMLAVLDKAKRFPEFRKYHQQAVSGVSKKIIGSFNYYRDFTVRLDEAFRFNNEGLIVFKIAMTNKSDKPVFYNTSNIGVRVGGTVYYSALTDASGEIPPKGTSQAYLVIGPSPTGEPNQLDLDNKWKILISRRDPPTNWGVAALPKALDEAFMARVNTPEEQNTEKLEQEIEQLKEQWNELKNERNMGQ